MVYSNERRRWPLQSCCRSRARTSLRGKAFCTGMMARRSCGTGLWRLMARWHWLSSMKRFRPGMMPTEETVMRLGLQPRPQSEVRMLQTARTASRLSMGSPMPMKTTLVSCSNSGMEKSWLRMSPADSEPWKPCCPVTQKRQPILQPTWHEMQRVARSSSGMKTVSTWAWPSNTEQVFLGAVAGDLAVDGEVAADVGHLGQAGALGEGEVGHGVDVVDALLVQPVAELLGREAWKTEVGTEFLQLAAGSCPRRLIFNS